MKNQERAAIIDAHSGKANVGPPLFPPWEIWLIPLSITFVHHDIHINRTHSK